MKIAVCSLYIQPWYREVTKYGKRSMEKYCEKNGYDFIYETEDTEDGVYDGKRDYPWYKIQLLLKVLKNKDYDFVVWNNADSMIINYDKKLESFIDKDLCHKDILVARDWNSTLNTGTVFVRNCLYSCLLLRMIWENTPSNKNLHEQSSLSDIYTRNDFFAQDRIVVLPLHRQNDFLSYWYSYSPSNCFIIHATRCSHDIPGFIFTMDMFCTLKMDEETDEQYKDRLDWLNSSRCLEDNEHYRNGGLRRNLTARYKLFISGKYKV
jgi:hypothetical protein